MGPKSRKVNSADAVASLKKKNLNLQAQNESQSESEDVFKKKKKQSKPKDIEDARPVNETVVKHLKPNALHKFSVPDEKVAKKNKYLPEKIEEIVPDAHEKSPKKKKHQKLQRVEEVMPDAEEVELPKKKKHHRLGMVEQVEIIGNKNISPVRNHTAFGRESVPVSDHSPSKKKRSIHVEEADDVDISLKKKRKLGKATSSVPASDNEPQKVVSEGTSPDPALWPNDDMNTLFSRVEKAIPKDDKFSYATRQEKLDWNAVAFGEYSGEECKAMWLQVTSRIRKFRLLSELVSDARVWLRKPWTTFKKKNTTEISKLIAEEYKLITPEEKEKLETEVRRQREEYNEKMKAFHDSHPDVTINMAAFRSGGPKKSRTPLQIFSEEKKPKLLEAGVSPKEALATVKLKWSSLSDRKRLKYISKAVDEYRKFKEEMEEYVLSHPDHQSTAKHTPILTRSEMELLLKSAGRPEKPPVNAYHIYIRDEQMAGHLDGVPITNSAAILGSRWKALSDKEREVYKERHREAKEDYVRQYEAYLNSLPEDYREWEALISQSAKSRKEQKDAVAEKKPQGKGRKAFLGEPEKPPSSPYQLFIQSFVKDSGLDSSEAEAYWDVLPNSDKEKFAAKHKELMRKYVLKFQQFLQSLNKKDLALYRKLYKDNCDYINNADAALNGVETSSKTRKEEPPASNSSGSSRDSEEDSSSSGEDTSDDEESGSGSGSESESEQEEVAAGPGPSKRGDAIIKVHPPSSSSEEEEDSD